LREYADLVVGPVAHIVEIHEYFSKGLYFEVFHKLNIALPDDPRRNS
jgi:hypothetical protein